MSKNIFIVDDHPMIRQGLRKMIEEKTDHKFVGEADNGVQALKLIEELKPDIIVVDISMPEMSGFELIRLLKKKPFAIEFIMLTMYKEEEYFNEAMELDVKGYLLKESTGAEFLKCLREVSLGNYYVSPELSGYLLKRTHAADTFLNQRPSLKLLTQMELKVLKLISENKTSKEIAEQLHISYRTVQNHRSKICEKLELEGYNKLLQFAIEHKQLL